jgi:hypothetical protein
VGVVVAAALIRVPPEPLQRERRGGEGKNATGFLVQNPHGADSWTGDLSFAASAWWSAVDQERVGFIWEDDS